MEFEELPDLPNKLVVDQIIDFSHLLQVDKKYTVFNPCITHYKDNLYLCCYRVWSRYIDDKDYIEVTKNIYANPNHPWRSRWGGNLDIDDSPIKGLIDITKFAMLQIDKIENNYDIKLVKQYSETFNDILPKKIEEVYLQDEGFQNIKGNKLKDLKDLYHLSDIKFWKWQDSRLIQTPTEGLFFIIGNVKTSKDKKIYRKNQDKLFNKDFDNCNLEKSREYNSGNKDNACYLLYLSALQVDPVTLKLIKITEPTILCPKFSARIEKNWSIFVDKIPGNKLRLNITYQIREENKGVELFTIDYNLEQLELIDDCKHKTLKSKNGVYETNSKNKSIKEEKKLSFFNSIEEAFENKLFISPSTPTIHFNNEELIGVGHIKFDYKHFDNQKWKDTPIKQFIDICKDRIINSHWGYIYLFFFYTLDKDTYKLKRTSNFFLPQPANVSLIFPVGLSKVGKTEYVISYGDYDTYSCAMFVNVTNIEQSLINIQKLNFVRDMNIIIKDNKATIKNKKEIQDEITSLNLFRFISWKNDKINKNILV